MSNLSQFFGGGGGFAPKSIVNSRSSTLAFNSTNAYPIPAASALSAGPKQVLSGACTPATLKTVLSVTGKGVISWLGFYPIDATSRTQRIKITLDGAVVFDASLVASTDTGGCVIIGACLGTTSVTAAVENFLFFDASLLVEYSTSLTETDKMKIGYIYYTR